MSTEQRPVLSSFTQFASGAVLTLENLRLDTLCELSVSASSASLSGRMPHDTRESEERSPIRGAVERIMLLNATSSTIFGSTTQPQALIVDRVLEEPFRHVGNFGVGEAGIGFSDVHQPFAIPNRKRVVAKHADALAVSVFDGRDDYVERR